MDFERLEQVWRSEANRPSEELQARLTEELMTTLKTRRRTELLLTAIPLGAMTLFTLVAGAAVLKGGESYRGWPGMAMLGVCWIVVLAVIWNFFRCRPRDTGRPLRDTISALLARNQAARRNYRVFCMMLPVFMMPLWVAIQRLQADDTMNTPAGWQAMAVCGVALAASLGWNTLRYFWVMKPEQRRLEALLEEYEG
jgi:hypothetical protein